MAVVFNDFAKMPDSIEPLTICCKSVATELKIVFKKSDGSVSRRFKMWNCFLWSFFD